jgi:hypothetical protein
MAAVRKAVVTGMGVALAISGMAAAGTSDGQGAQKSPLVVTQPPFTATMSQCQKAGAGATNGFAILNAPGKVGSVEKINGEVSLKRGPANTTFVVNLAKGGVCTVTGTLHTNNVGNGNSHINQAGFSAGTYYVVLKNTMGREQYASNPVVLK